jgi:hypothetical protein
MKKTLLIFIAIVFVMNSFGQCPPVIESNTSTLTNKGCTSNGWLYQQNASSGSSGSCLNFSGSLGCGIAYNALPISTQCNFCVDYNFSFDISGDPDCPNTSSNECTADGFAITFLDLGTTKAGAQVLPCNFSPSCSPGGGLGYSSFQSTFTHDGGLVIEYDFFSNPAACDRIRVVQLSASGGTSTTLASSCINTQFQSQSNPFEQGDIHSSRICIDATTSPATLTVSINGTTIINTTINLSSIFKDPDQVWFTVSSGWAPNQPIVTNICNITVLDANAAEANFSANLSILM